MLSDVSQDSTEQPSTLWQDKPKETIFDAWEIVTIVNTILSNVVCLLGLASNIVNLLVIIRQGFADSVNVSLLGLTISDMGGLMSLLWLKLCSRPLIVKLVDPPYSPSDFCFMPAGVLRVGFSRTSCYFTIFITVQRCLCISHPLKIKSLMTPSNTRLIMLSISFAAFFLHCFGLSCTGVAYIGWKHVPFQNKSLLGLITSENFQEVYNTGTLITTFLQITSFLAIILCTTILVNQLRQNTKWRNSAITTSADKAQIYSSRGQKIGMMVAFLSGILIACYTPSTTALILSLCLADIRNVGTTDEKFNFFWSLGFLCEAVKSGVNVFVYYTMSSKYRITFNLIISKHKEY
ncbi:hypothetical protein BsWGS_27598 [Bradybaena similaris]